MCVNSRGSTLNESFQARAATADKENDADSRRNK
jgi:hypothetical protein